MKLIIALTILASTFSSCSNIFNKGVLNSAKEAKDGSENFVINKNGKKIGGSDVKINVKRNSHRIGDVEVDGNYYSISDLTNVQTDAAFYTNFGNKWFYRIYNGKIEAYLLTEEIYRAENKINTTQTRSYLRKNGGELVVYTSNNLFNLISDNKSSLEFFNSLFKSKNDNTPWDYQFKKLLSVLESYK